MNPFLILKKPKALKLTAKCDRNLVDISTAPMRCRSYGGSFFSHNLNRNEQTISCPSMNWVSRTVIFRLNWRRRREERVMERYSRRLTAAKKNDATYFYHHHPPPQYSSLDGIKSVRGFSGGKELLPKVVYIVK